MALPVGYRWLRAQGAALPRPWGFLATSAAAERLRREYLAEGGADDALPFARRQDRDDVMAVFVVDAGGRATGVVRVVRMAWRDGAGDGPAVEGEHADVFAWLTERVFADARALAGGDEGALEALLGERD